eukprot:1191345-Prorocentrum_minimum.AAC.4
MTGKQLVRPTLHHQSVRLEDYEKYKNLPAASQTNVWNCEVDSTVSLTLPGLAPTPGRISGPAERSEPFEAQPCS